MSVDRPDKSESRFGRTSWLVLMLSLFLIFFSAAQLTYRFSLPTDGWAVITSDNFEHPDWVYWNDLVGTPSELMKGDTLQAVADQSVVGTATVSSSPRPADWIAGKRVPMTVIREGQPLVVSVPVVNWSLRAWWKYNVAYPPHLINLLGAVVLISIGGFTFLRRPGVPSAHALLILCTAIFASALSGMLPDGLSVQFDQLAFMMTGFFSYLIFGTVLAPSLLAFTLLFPQPKRVIRRRPWLALLPFAWGLFVLVALVSGGPITIGWVSTMAMIVVAIISLIHSGFTQRDAVSRAQLRWAIGGFGTGLALMLLVFPAAFGWVTDPLLSQILGSGFSLGITVAGVALGIAVLRYRLFDIDVIIRKTLVYAVLTGLLAMIYFGTVLLLQALFTDVSGQGSAVAIVISTLAIAALFNPLRRRVQRWINRRFYRSKYNAEKTLAEFALTARDEVDLDQLTAELMRVVEEAMQPESAGLWLGRLEGERYHR